MGDKLSALAWVRVADGRRQRVSMSDEQSCVGLKTTWKPNLRFLFFGRHDLSASILPSLQNDDR
jgi:hypothetical protein